MQLTPFGRWKITDHLAFLHNMDLEAVHEEGRQLPTVGDHPGRAVRQYPEESLALAAVAVQVRVRRRQSLAQEVIVLLGTTLDLPAEDDVFM